MNRDRRYNELTQKQITSKKIVQFLNLKHINKHDDDSNKKYDNLSFHILINIH